MIILGIDPGTASTGYGIIKAKNQKRKSKKNLKSLGYTLIKYGVIKTEPSLSTPERLKKLSNELNNLIKQYRPEVLAVENVYFFKNLKTAMPVSQAKGVILLTAAKKKIPVYEFTPLEIKKTIVDYGWAEKQKVQEKIKLLLNLNETRFSDDAADALAVAICYARFFFT